MTGFELKLWRKGQRWTQEQAAKELGITRRTYIKYENTNPPHRTDLAIQALSIKSIIDDIDTSDKAKNNALQLTKSIVNSRGSVSKKLWNYEDITNSIINQLELYPSIDLYHFWERLTKGFYKTEDHDKIYSLVTKKNLSQ